MPPPPHPVLLPHEVAELGGMRGDARGRGEAAGWGSTLAREGRRRPVGRPIKQPPRDELVSPHSTAGSESADSAVYDPAHKSECVPGRAPRGKGAWAEDEEEQEEAWYRAPDVPPERAAARAAHGTERSKRPGGRAGRRAGPSPPVTSPVGAQHAPRRAQSWSRGGKRGNPGGSAHAGGGRRGRAGSREASPSPRERAGPCASAHLDLIRRDPPAYGDGTFLLAGTKATRGACHRGRRAGRTAG